MKRKKHKILIVDDDPSQLRLFEKMLADDRVDILTAANGEEALRIVVSEEPRIVITDWMMPEMDGIELCRKLRQYEGIRFVYVIIVTAYSEIKRINEAFSAGADDFLSKPVRRPELMARLRAGEHIARLESDLAKRTREVHRVNAEMAMAQRELNLANEKLNCMAITDELTGLINRREAMNRLRELHENQSRYDQIYSCIMVDIDRFKKFNDTYGHAAGDFVLSEAAQVLCKNTRKTDKVCRIGGEEFLVICPHVDLEGAMVCAEHLRSAVEQHRFVFEGKELSVTISLGVAQWASRMKTFEEILKTADKALYESKNTGRNRVTAAEMFTSSNTQSVST